MINCDKIAVESARLKTMFTKCYNLKAIDLRSIVDLIESVSACSGGSFNLKTVNGQSLLGIGDIIVTAVVDGTETKVQQGTGITVSGNGSVANPYVITNSSISVADGSETKINQGSNITIAGTGTIANPYVINAVIPAGADQVNADWAAISGISMILNKPNIPTKTSDLVNDGTNGTNPFVVVGQEQQQSLQEVIDIGGYAEKNGSYVNFLAVEEGETSSGLRVYSSDLISNSNLSMSGRVAEISNQNISQTGFININDGFINIQENNETTGNLTSLSFEPSVSDTNIKIPAKTVSGTYTLATTDEVDSVDLQKVLGDIGGEASFTNLAGNQYISFFNDEGDASKNSIISSNSNEGGSEIEVSDSSITLRNFNQITQENTAVGGSDGQFSIFQTGNSGATSTIVTFTPPLADTTLNLPAKTIPGAYTLATTDEVNTIDLQKVINVGGYAEVDAGNSFIDILSGDENERMIRLRLSDSEVSASLQITKSESILRADDEITEDYSLIVARPYTTFFETNVGTNQQQVVLGTPLADSVVVNFPTPSISGTYTLATTDDIDAVGLQAVLESNPSANFDSGLSQLKLLESDENGFFIQTIIKDSLLNGSQLYINKTGINISHENPDLDKSALISASDGNVAFQEIKSGLSTTLNFEPPIAQTNLKLPAKEVTGTYTLATTDEIDSIDLQKVISTGGFGSFNVEGKSQEIYFLNDGDDPTTAFAFSSEDVSTGGGAFSVDETQVALSHSNYTNSKSGLFHVSNGVLKIEQLDSGNRTSVNFQDPTVVSTLKFPAKTVAGTYTLATTDEVNTIDLQKVVDVNGYATITGTGSKYGAFYLDETGASMFGSNSTGDNYSEVGVDNGKVVFSSQYLAKKTSIAFDNAIEDTTLNFPAKTVAGTYTLDVTSDTLYTVGTLPSGVLNDKAIVTDATAPTYLGVLVGGGSVVTPVWHNGTIWVSH